MKGVLPWGFHRHASEEVDTPFFEANTSTMPATGCVQPSETVEENNDLLQIETMQEGAVRSNATRDQQKMIENAKQKIIESWKVVSITHVHLKYLS